jgi:hypothetical protein
MSNHTLVNYGGDYPEIQKYRDGWLVPVNIIETTLENGSVSYDAYQVFVPVLTEHELEKAFGDLKDIYPEDFKKAAFYHIRQKRDQLLAETDWLITKAKETGTNIPAALKEYRQALRDLPDTYESADDVVFPMKP